MKIKIKRICAVILVIVLSALSLQYFGVMLDPKHMPIVYGQIKEFHQLEENSLDVVILGTSHSWKGVDAKILSDNCNINAYNYSCYWQHLNTTNLFFKDCMENQSPKVVFVETFRPTVLEDAPMDGEIYYTRYLPNSKWKKEYLEQCFQGDLERYASYCIPIISFHESWDTIDKESFESLDARVGKLKKSRGYNPSFGTKSIKLLSYEELSNEELEENSLKILDEMVEECQSRGIEIVFFTVPYCGDYVYSEAFEKYAEQSNCDYINFFQLADEIGIDKDTDFADSGHLNTNGAAKVSTYLANYIKEKGYSN